MQHGPHTPAGAGGLTVLRTAGNAALQRLVEPERFPVGPGIQIGPAAAAQRLTLGHLVPEPVDHAAPPLQRFASGAVIQRHSSFEHYMLGQINPERLAEIPLVREAEQIKEKLKKLEDARDMVQALSEAGLMEVDEDALEDEYGPKIKEVKDQLEALGADEETYENVKHTLEQEMNRLLEWASNPEAVKTEDTQLGEVKKGENGEWQVPYISVPVADGTVAVSYSEMNTLPDMFANPETMAKLPKAKFISILQGVRQQTYNEMDKLYKEIFGEFRSPLKGTIWDTEFKKAKGPKAQRATGPLYAERKEMELNKVSKYKGQEKSEQYFAAVERNACHFAPYSWDAWQRYHEKARTLAAEAASDKDLAKDLRDLYADSGVDAYKDQAEKDEGEAAKKANEAMLQSAFGEHYLQDSFAAGHLVDKTKIMQWFMQWLESEGVRTGVFQKAATEWKMAFNIAQQQSVGDPQKLDDEMMRGETGTLDEVAESHGLEPRPEIIFMMWWRQAAIANKKNATLTPDEAAAKCKLPGVTGDAVAAKAAMDKLLNQRFADVKKGKYTLDSGVIRTAKPKSFTRREPAYEARLAQKSNEEGTAHDFRAEAIEFNVASLNAFLSNMYIQAASGYFHDKYCKEGLQVIAGNGAKLHRIYGDSNMLKAGGQVGVEYSAETSQMSREAIFNIINGEPGRAATTKTIRDRFPAQVEGTAGPISLADWNKQLKADGEKGAFKEAQSGAARFGRSIQDGLSKGNALNAEKIVQQGIDAIPVPEQPF